METRVIPTIHPACRCDHPRVACRVLIVDDDPAFLELAGRIVAEFGVAVVATARDARQAAEVAAASRPDAVLVDVGLPDRDGSTWPMSSPSCRGDRGSS
jgi:DNA-binding NtrC family response regulator